jgi:hypothetical protein
VGDAYRKQIAVKDAHNLQWITIIECTSAAGTVLPLLVIFAGKYVQQQWFPNDTDDRWASWYFTTLPTGWTNNNIAIQWLKTVFIPNAPPTAAYQWRVLILDGHKSYTSREFMELCIEYKIYIVFLCPHTLYICQPNDLGPYSHFKRAYKSNLAFMCISFC